MNNLSSYCGLIDAKIRASGKDLPVLLIIICHLDPRSKNISAISIAMLIKQVHNVY